MSDPIVTVIIATYNCSKYLQQAIDSVISQTYKKINLIVVDGSSTDNTVEVIKQNNDKIFYWISEKDTGIYNAWNKGLKHVNGDWVCFLGADDYFWKTNSVELMVNHLKKVPTEINIAYSQIMLLNESDEKLFVVGEAWCNIKNKFLKIMCIPHQGVMHRAELFKRFGDFNEEFKIAGDYELMLRDLKNNDAVFVPEIILTGMRQGGVSSNPKNVIKVLKEYRKAQKIHLKTGVSLTWRIAYFRVLVRYCLFKLFGQRLTNISHNIVRTIEGKNRL